MQKKFLEAGEIVGTHGIHGEVKILPGADSPDFLLSFDTYYIKGTPRRVLSARVHKTCVLAKLEGVETPEQASLLRRQVICIDREVISLPEGSVYIADLLDCRVLDEDGQELGTIYDVLSLPANDVYVVRGAKRQYMIPVVREFVREINVAEGYVRVHVIEGMATDAD